MTNDSLRLSVIVPCYNERRRIGETLAQFDAYLRRQPYKSEIILVDDGSTDGTAPYVRENFAAVRVIDYRPNRGKGHASKVGFEESKAPYRLISDADASTPIDELEKFWPEIDAGADIVIGSRALPHSQIEVRQPWYRQNMGRTYNLVLRSLGLTQFPDTQCGFKLFTGKACDVILPRQTADGFGADAEWLYISRRHGLRVAQVPVRWINSPDTRVHAVLDSVDMLGEVLKIRWNALRGRYR
ncbi:MAG: dolichyl-phosphate beta-glucosyltransferase [Candidatus Hydrogenedentales bacterium]